MKIVSSISKTIPIFKDPHPPRWLPVGFLNSSFWLLIMLFASSDPKHLDEIERIYLKNENANNDGFLHTPQMALLAGSISITSLVSCIFMASRSVKEIKRVGDAISLVNWRSRTIMARDFYQTDKGWLARIPLGLRSWDAVIVANGKRFLVNTRGNDGFLQNFNSH